MIATDLTVGPWAAIPEHNLQSAQCDLYLPSALAGQVTSVGVFACSSLVGRMRKVRQPLIWAVLVFLELIVAITTMGLRSICDGPRYMQYPLGFGVRGFDFSFRLFSFTRFMVGVLSC